MALMGDSRSHRIFRSEAPRPACWGVSRGFGGLKEGVCCRGGGEQRLGGWRIRVLRGRPPAMRGVPLLPILITLAVPCVTCIQDFGGLSAPPHPSGDGG